MNLQKQTPYNGGQGYTGKGDASLNFGKATHFGDADKSDNKIVLSIKNTGGADKVVKLFQAFNGGVAGNDADGVLTDGVIGGIETLIGATTRGTIADIKAFIGTGKSLYIGKMKIQSSVADQLQEAFKWVKKNIFRNEPDELIAIPDYTTEQNLNQNMVTVVKDFQIDSDTDFSIKVLAGSTLNITLYVDAYLDLNNTLSAKAQAASLNPAVAGLQAARSQRK